MESWILKRGLKCPKRAIFLNVYVCKQIGLFSCKHAWTKLLMVILLNTYVEGQLADEMTDVGDQEME